MMKKYILALTLLITALFAIYFVHLKSKNTEYLYNVADVKVYHGVWKPSNGDTMLIDIRSNGEVTFENLITMNGVMTGASTYIVDTGPNGRIFIDIFGSHHPLFFKYKDDVLLLEHRISTNKSEYFDFIKK